MTSAGLFEPHCTGADYVDAYVSQSKGVQLGEVRDHAIQRGKILEQNEDEIVFQDYAPGLRFVVSYRLDEVANTLTFSTAVHYESGRGRVYFSVIRPFHLVLAPLVPRLTVRKALRARQ